MDIKLKSIKYSAGAKAAAFVVLWLFMMCAAGSAMFLMYYHETIDNKSYYDTYQFRNEFNKLVFNVVEFNVKLKSEANIKSSGEAEDAVKSNLQRYYLLKQKLSDTVNFAYYFKNTHTGEVATNIKTGDAIALIKKQPSVVYYNQWTYEPNNYRSDHDLGQMLTDAPYEVYAAVIEPLKAGDEFYDSYMNFTKAKTVSTYVTILLVLSTILMFLSFIYLVVVTGRQEKGGEIVLSFTDRIYTDVYSVLVFIAAVISVAIVTSFSYSLSNQVIMFIVALIFGLDILIGLSYVLSMIRQIKNGQIFRNTLCYKIFDLCFNGKTFKVWTLLLLIGYGLINGILFAAAASSGAGFIVSVFLLIPFNTAAIYFAAKSLLSLTQIMEAAKEISTGNLDYTLDNSQISVAFAGFAKDIQSIQGGMKKAVAEAVKGERMKTDLIANVSHDLKTPLTSIINYVDLLKKEDLNNEEADKYVYILEEKSDRLKQLIEDLIEASKASSGNVNVHTEKVDLHELVIQACGEYEEKIKKAELDIHVNDEDDKKTFVSADGKHMWRIVENLLSNVVKYSMPHSRVYINIGESELYGLLTVKNISANPLDILPEQLTERFVRGDASRTTEGSGLGLSIAQSLTNIQGGRFKIEIDGDLFKVMVEVPLWLEK